jgi:hypothetical protein
MQFADVLPNLPPAVARETLSGLISALPPPAIDTPEAVADRDATAIAAVAALHPADAFEALLAAQIVVNAAHARHGLRLAVRPGQDEKVSRQCRTQANAMTRLMQSGMRSFRRDRAEREKAEAAMHPAAMERAGWWFRDASVAAPAAASPAAEAEAEPQVDIAAEAEFYAGIYPRRAGLIRSLGRMPDNPDFDPLSPEMVAAIIAGDGPNMRAADAEMARL